MELNEYKKEVTLENRFIGKAHQQAQEEWKAKGKNAGFPLAKPVTRKVTIAASSVNKTEAEGLLAGYQREVEDEKKKNNAYEQKRLMEVNPSRRDRMQQLKHNRKQAMQMFLEQLKLLVDAEIERLASKTH